MIAVTATLPRTHAKHPPLLLVHGASSSAPVWTYWQAMLAERGWASYAVDLRGHGRSAPVDLADVSMRDYADDVGALLRDLARRPVVIGWSMGGLVALMVAAGGGAVACVGLGPSTPALAVDPTAPRRRGVFGPEEYGITSRDPAHQPAMPDLDRPERAVALGALGPESRRARDDRKAGVVIESLPCPLLIVCAADDRSWGREHYRDLWLPADALDVEGASHWGLVLNRRALASMIPAVLHWIERNVAGEP